MLANPFKEGRRVRTDEHDSGTSLPDRRGHRLGVGNVEYGAPHHPQLGKGSPHVLLNPLQLILRPTNHVHGGPITLGARHDAHHALKLRKRPNPTPGGDSDLPRGAPSVGSNPATDIQEILARHPGADNAPQQHSIGEDEGAEL